MFRKLIYVSIAALVLVGCKEDEGGDDLSNSTSNNNTTSATNNNATTGTNNGVPGGLQVLRSKNPRVRFKGGERWSDQLARGLELERAELCQEFGQYDCAKDVHFIALGGMEPYRLRAYKPLPTPPITAPIAVERIALSACSERAERDIATPAEAVVFKELSDSPTTDDFTAMGNRMYQRLLSRDAEAVELAEFEAFWTELAAEDGVDLQMEWATLSCFAIASSTEMLFY